MPVAYNPEVVSKVICNRRVVKTYHSGVKSVAGYARSNVDRAVIEAGSSLMRYYRGAATYLHACIQTHQCLSLWTTKVYGFDLPLYPCFNSRVSKERGTEMNRAIIVHVTLTIVTAMIVAVSLVSCFGVNN
jgi:hypothetical protein